MLKNIHASFVRGTKLSLKLCNLHAMELVRPEILDRNVTQVTVQGTVQRSLAAVTVFLYTVDSLHEY